MLTLSILLSVLIVITVIVVIALGATGVMIILVFGDVLLAGAIIYMIIRAITKKN